MIAWELKGAMSGPGVGGACIVPVRKLLNGELNEIVAGEDPLNRGPKDLRKQVLGLKPHFSKTVMGSEGECDLVILRMRGKPLVGGVSPTLPLGIMSPASNLR